MAHTGFKHLRILGLSSTRISNKLLLNGTLNECKTLTQLNLSRTRISDKRLDQLVLPVLSQLNLDWTRVTPSGCLTLLTGIDSLRTFGSLRRRRANKLSERRVRAVKPRGDWGANKIFFLVAANSRLHRSFARSNLSLLACAPNKTASYADYCIESGL